VLIPAVLIPPVLIPPCARPNKSCLEFDPPGAVVSWRWPLPPS
jgi:hypothetical protein